VTLTSSHLLRFTTGRRELGQKRRSHHTGHGGADDHLKDKRLKEVKHTQEGVQGKGNGMTVEKRKRPVSDTGGTEKKKQCGQGVVGTGDEGGGDTVSTTAKEPSEGLRRVEHLQAQPPKKSV